MANMNSADQELDSLSSPRLAVTISGCFLSVIFALPLMQFVGELASLHRAWPTAWQMIPALQRAYSTPAPPHASLIQRLLTVNDRLCVELREYETQVTRSAWLVSGPRDGLQLILSGWLRSGNEQVVVGPDGWLLFRPDVEALTGTGFLDPGIHKPGIAASRRHPDPLPAITQFAADLRTRGIELLIVPVPSKAALLGTSSGKHQPRSAIHNASYQQFVKTLRQSQIPVCDLTEILLNIEEASRQPTPMSGRYLKSDSHWSPEGMRRAAQVVAAQQLITTLPRPEQRPSWQMIESPVENVGDTARLLGQSASRGGVPAERCDIQRILDQQGADWQPDPAADILLLGDSFTNIYSQQELGWGSSAGLAEHLSQILNRPLDRIALNAGGALASRRELLRQLQQGQDRLAGKKLVIWQFAERELSQGDWQVLPLQKEAVPALPAMPANSSMVEGIIAQTGILPDPASLPYREVLLPLHLKSVNLISKSPMVPPEVVVYVWGMRDRQLTPQSAWKPGQTVRLKLTPWSQAEKQYGRFARAELDDPDLQLIDLPTYWGEP